MKDLLKVERVIESCNTRQQLTAAIKYLGLYQARELKDKYRHAPMSYFAILSRKNKADRKASELYKLICLAERKSELIWQRENLSLWGLLTGQ